jgi:hypothetical protein
MATDFELQVLAELSEIKVTAATAAATSTALATRLFDGNSGVISTLQSDIIEIKQTAAEDRKSNNIKDYIHYSATPVLVGIHAFLKHLGVDI